MSDSDDDQHEFRRLASNKLKIASNTRSRQDSQREEFVTGRLQYATNENTTNLKTEAPPSLQFKPNNIHGIEEEEKDEPKQELGENTPLKPLRDVDQPKDNETRKKKRQDSVKEMAIDAPMQAPKPTFVSEVSFEILAET